MNKMEDFTDRAVPENAGPRYKWLYLANVENAVTVCVPVFMFGAMLGQSLDVVTLCWALLLAGIALALTSGWSSYIGVKTRLSTALMIEKSFGRQGAKLVWFVLAASLFGWFGVQTELFGRAFMALAKAINPDTPINGPAVTIIAGLLMSTTAILGIKGVGKLAQLSIPLLLGTMIYALFSAVQIKGWGAWLSFVPATPTTLGTAIAAIIGGYSVGIITMPDIKRFAVNSKHSIGAAVLALGICYPLLLLLTAVTSVLMQEPDFMALLLNFGLGSFALVILMLATWTSNDMNLYGASLSLSRLLPRLSRAWLTALAGLLGTLIATMGLFENMIPLFMLLGVLTTPLLAIYSLDYLNGKFDADSATPVPINWAAFAVWIAASLAGWASTPADKLGLGLYTLTTVPGLDSLFVAMILYFVQKRLCLFKPSLALKP